MVVVDNWLRHICPHATLFLLRVNFIILSSKYKDMQLSCVFQKKKISLYTETFYLSELVMQFLCLVLLVLHLSIINYPMSKVLAIENKVSTYTSTLVCECFIHCESQGSISQQSVWINTWFSGSTAITYISVSFLLMRTCILTYCEL